MSYMQERKGGGGSDSNILKYNRSQMIVMAEKCRHMVPTHLDIRYLKEIGVAPTRSPMNNVEFRLFVQHNRCDEKECASLRNTNCEMLRVMIMQTPNNGVRGGSNLGTVDIEEVITCADIRKWWGRQNWQFKLYNKIAEEGKQKQVSCFHSATIEFNNWNEIKCENDNLYHLLLNIYHGNKYLKFQIMSQGRGKGGSRPSSSMR